ncbi:protein takeout-like [Adelges cooleyi]|uniref:protein takeout-like n=1 Tax=Adelges cooleyi TaxID=133065 RepID=UPI00217F9CC7|nr:protein takeout-like [Adelges cooleyi]
MLARPIRLLCYMFALALAVPAAFAKGPSMLLSFTPCRLSDPNLNQCIWKALDEAIPIIAPGVPRLGLPQMDPYHLKSMEVSKGQSQNQVVFKLRDLDVHGIRSFAINAINFDRKTYKCFVGIEARERFINKGFYEISGRLFMVPVQGKGKFETWMDNYKSNFTIQFQKITKDGEYFLEPLHLSKTISVSRIHFHFYNLFNGNRILGDTVNNLMNQNWEEMLDDFKPTIMKLFDQVFMGYIKTFCQTVPMGDYLQD